MEPILLKITLLGYALNTFHKTVGITDIIRPCLHTTTYVNQ